MKSLMIIIGKVILMGALFSTTTIINWDTGQMHVYSSNRPGSVFIVEPSE